MVPYRWPLRKAQSSTPSTRGAGCSGTVTRRMRRSRVAGLAVIPSRSTILAPGSPPSANASMTEDRLEPRRPPSVRGDEVRQPFGEDPPRAGRLAAVELADTQVETDRLATPWQVSDRPLVVAVDRLGPRSAPGARPSRSRGLKRGDDLVRADRHVSKPEAVPERKQVGGEGASAWHRSKSYRPPSPSPPKSRESQGSVARFLGLLIANPQAADSRSELRKWFVVWRVMRTQEIGDPRVLY